MSPTSLAGRRIAVTGASGFVGSHVVRQLLQQGAQIVALTPSFVPRAEVEAVGAEFRSAELHDLGSLTRAMTDCEFVIHIAGLVDLQGDWERHWRVNVVGTQHVLQAAMHVGAQRLVHVSSIFAVGATATPTELDESATWDLGRLQVPYVTTKRMAEEHALAAPLDVVVVNPGCIIGPDDRTESVMGTLCRRSWLRRLHVSFSGGNNFVDVRDVAAGCIAALRRGRIKERYLLTGANCTNWEFLQRLRQHECRWRLPIHLPATAARVGAAIGGCLTRRPVLRPDLSPEQARLFGRYFYFSHDKAHRELGFQPRPMAESLTDALSDWRRRSAA